MKAYRQLKMTLFAGILIAVVLGAVLGSPTAALIYPAAVFGTLIGLYFYARKHIADPNFEIEVAGRSLLAVGNMALGMGLVLMGALVFKEIGALTGDFAEMWYHLSYIVAPLLEGAATATVATFLWDDLQGYAAVKQPRKGSRSQAGASGTFHHGPSIDVKNFQDQLDALGKTLKDLAEDGKGMQDNIKKHAEAVKQSKQALKDQSKASKEQIQETGQLIGVIRDMVANYQSFITPTSLN